MDSVRNHDRLLSARWPLGRQADPRHVQQRNHEGHRDRDAAQCPVLRRSEFRNTRPDTGIRCNWIPGMNASPGWYPDAPEEWPATRRDGLDGPANARNPCPRSPPAEKLLAAGSARTPNPPAVFARTPEIEGVFRSYQSLRTAAANL